MEQMIQKEFGMNKKAKVILILMMIGFLAATVVMMYVLGQEVNESLSHGVKNDIVNIGDQNAKAIRSEVNGKIVLIEALAEQISESGVRDIDHLLEQMRTFVPHYNFYNMSILTNDGTMYTTQGTVLDVSGFEYFKKLQKTGETVVSDSYLAVDGSGRNVNVFATPVWEDGEIIFSVTASYRSSDLANLLNYKPLRGKGFSFIVGTNGVAVIQPTYNVEPDYLELVQYISKNSDILPTDDSDECVEFSYDGKGYYAHFERLGIEDWHLMTCIKKTDAYEDMALIERANLMRLGMLWLVMLIMVFIGIVMYFRYQKLIQKIVFTDPLLEQKNATYLTVYIAKMSQEERDKRVLAVLDIDNFKTINLIYGAKYGDYLLRYIDKVFREELPEDEIFRDRADSFNILIKFDDEDEIVEKLERFVHRIESDIEKHQVILFVPSIGVCFMRGYDELHTIYSNALLAKNLIKGNHIKKYAFYDNRVRQKNISYMEMEAAFDQALQKQEFKVYYQPKFDMRNQRVIGSEALVRWVKPDGTIVSPGAFIPCFENSGQIIQLDEAMIEMVCLQMKDMIAKGIDVQIVSINLSRVHLQQSGIVEKIHALIDSLDIDPSKLAFEITESALYDDNIALGSIVSKLHEIGCRVDMDDYGTGISSLHSLANVDFDVVKLDKSFIDKIGDKKMESIIKSTISLSEDLGMRLIAEGVEEKEQVEFLVENHGIYAQGFYYSKPVPLDSYETLLKQEMYKK